MTTTSAREAHAAALERHNAAAAAAQSIRDRARAGENVTGSDLADADAELELAALRLPALEEAALAEEQAEALAKVNAAADRYLKGEPPARAAFLDAITAARSALRSVKDAALAHDRVRSEVERTAGVMGVGGEWAYNVEGSRIRNHGRYPSSEVRVDGQPVRRVDVETWLRVLLSEALDGHTGYGNAPWPPEA